MVAPSRHAIFEALAQQVGLKAFGVADEAACLDWARAERRERRNPSRKLDAGDDEPGGDEDELFAD